MNPPVAILVPNLGLGGAERIAISLAEVLGNGGQAVDLVALSAVGPLVPHVPSSARLIDLKASRLRSAIPALYRYFRQERPAAAFVNVWPLTLTATIAARTSGSGTPVVAMHQNSLSRQYVATGRHSALTMRAALRLEIALATRVVGCSEGVVADLARLAGYSPDRLQAVPNPVTIRRDVSKAALAAAEAMWSVPRGRRLLAVGNLKAQKNFGLLLEAYAHVDKGEADRLIIIGEGECRAALEAQVRDLRLEARVALPGQSDCLEAFYRTADAFVLSSRYEGLPTVLIEALGFGLPVVSTDCPSGPREILADGRFGTLVPMDDPQALSQAIAKALSGPADQALLMSRANDFAPDVVAKRLMALVRDQT